MAFGMLALRLSLWPLESVPVLDGYALETVLTALSTSSWWCCAAVQKENTEKRFLRELEDNCEENEAISGCELPLAWTCLLLRCSDLAAGRLLLYCQGLHFPGCLLENQSLTLPEELRSWGTSLPVALGRPFTDSLDFKDTEPLVRVVLLKSQAPCCEAFGRLSLVPSFTVLHALCHCMLYLLLAGQMKTLPWVWSLTSMNVFSVVIEDSNSKFRYHKETKYPDLLLQPLIWKKLQFFFFLKSPFHPPSPQGYSSLMAPAQQSSSILVLRMLLLSNTQ